MSFDNRLDRRTLQLERNLRLYRTFTMVLLLAIVVLVAWLIVRDGRKFARAIRIDGHIVCLVKNMEAAKRVHELLLAQDKDDLPGEAALEQQWQDEAWPVDDAEVLSISDAVEILKGKVNVLVGCCVIEVDGTKAVYLPSTDFADDVLTALKASYVNQGEKIIGEQTFLENVKPTAGRARAGDITSDIHGALRLLSGTKREEKKYTVKSGDYPEKIAAAHGMKVQELSELNPKIRGRTLQPGQILTVALARAAITVRTTKEITETRELPPGEAKRNYSSSLPRGESRVVSPGEPGEKLLRVHLIYHNDAIARRDEKSGQVIKPPSPKVVLVGTGDKPEPASSSSGDAASTTRGRPTTGTRPE